MIHDFERGRSTFDTKKVTPSPKSPVNEHDPKYR